MGMRAVATGLGMTAVAAMAMGTAPAASAEHTATPAPSPTRPDVVQNATPQQPPECDTHCTAVKDLPLPNNARLISWNDEDAMGGHLAYYVDGKLRDVANFEFKSIADASCGWEGDAQRCTVTYDTGAHASGAMSALLTYDQGIEVTDDVLGGAPGARLVHLDDNGRADVALRQSTLDPNYAEAPQYWETHLEFEGNFARTGCTDPTAESDPVPTEPAYGNCAYN